jgi:hypothetical protein
MTAMLLQVATSWPVHVHTRSIALRDCLSDLGPRLDFLGEERLLRSRDSSGPHGKAACDAQAELYIRSCTVHAEYKYARI